MSKAWYLSEDDATCSQEFDQVRREVQLTYGEMAQFQQHVRNNVMKMREYCKQAQESRQILESQVQLYYRKIYRVSSV